MKRTLKLLGIVAAMAVIGFSVMSCDDGSDNDILAGRVVAQELRGEWVESTIAAGVATVRRLRRWFHQAQ